MTQEHATMCAAALNSDPTKTTQFELHTIESILNCSCICTMKQSIPEFAHTLTI